MEIVLNEFDFLVSETDAKGYITYSNMTFEKISGFTQSELRGKNHNIVRHQDMPVSAFKNLWDTIKSGKVWTGYVKNRTKNGDFYWVYATIYPFEKIDGSYGYMSCRRRASIDEITDAENYYKDLK